MLKGVDSYYRVEIVELEEYKLVDDNIIYVT